VNRPPDPSRTRSAIAALAVLLIALMLGAGAATWARADPPADSPPSPVGVPAAPQTNVSRYPALAHLGRWNGTTFIPVAAGSIAAGPTIVISHGWSPGYLATYQRLQAASPTLVTAWTPGLVDGSGVSMLTDFVALAVALQAADPSAAVVMFSWIDQSATPASPLEARRARLAAEVNGHRLAVAINQALAPDFAAKGGQIHLIGHSFGANVVTTAALALDHRPRQLTLLDSPEIELTRLGGAKNDLQYTLPRIDIGRGPGQTFVDNYISLLGQQYSTVPGLDQIVDVRTQPPSGSSAEKHSFAIVWYTDSVAGSHPSVGYGWSPLTGHDIADVGQSYTQGSVADPLQLTEDAPPPSLAVRSTLRVTELPLVSTVADEAVADPALVTESAGVSVQANGPTTADVSFTTTGDSLWLLFDTRIAGGPGDLVTIFIDGRARSQIGGRADRALRPSDVVILYDLSPGPHTLSVTLGGATADQPASSTAVASVSNLRLASTGGIVRNLTDTRTNELAALVVLVSIELVGFVIAALVVVGIVIIGAERRRRRPSLSRTEAGLATSA
jgi:hypothetical protein